MELEQKRRTMKERSAQLANLRKSAGGFCRSVIIDAPGFGDLTQRIFAEGPDAVRRDVGDESFNRLVRFLAANVMQFSLKQTIDLLELEIDALEDPIEPNRTRRTP